MMRATIIAIAPTSHLLFHLITQARPTTSFTIPPASRISRLRSFNRRHDAPITNPFAMTRMTTLASVTAGGGDYAGLSATFSSKNGDLIPVPEHLVPESMIEWGDIPYLEVLASEESLEKSEKMERTTITVLPEVGCGIDNLETTKKVEEYNLKTDESRYVEWKDGKGQDVLVMDRKVGDKLLAVETIFQVASEIVTSDDDTSSEDTEQVYLRRIRISFTIDTTSKLIIKDTITINIERLFSTTSTKGTRWSGPQHNSGGLDARSVLKTIGKDIVYGDVFGVKRVKSGEDVWTLEVEEAVKSSLIEGEEGDHYIRLPQNILIKFCNNQTELSHFNVIDSKLYRRSVLRSFDGSEDGFSIAHYSEEEKALGG